MYFFSKQITGMNKLAFVWVLFLIYIVLGFFIQSSSGLAVLAMLIMAPLANIVGVDRASVIDPYNWSQGHQDRPSWPDLDVPGYGQYRL